jgi:16S rRNA A1518/A1519 N6-dimethyltransferase RsmA/KsgA/DIM1 with predicted DNA glycosylase/AP lyase activity
VEKEIELARIKEKTNVLHIGGGIPYTAEIIARRAGANVVSLEVDSKIVDAAREWIMSRKFEEKIKVVSANGMNFNVSGFDVIILSLNAAPKEKILSNIFNTCDMETKIIYRSARKPLDIVYEDKDILNRYKAYIKSYVHQEGSFVGRSYLLTKNGKME